jgi:replicative DNA helicase
MLDTLPQQKALPHSEESERAVLAAVLVDPRVLPSVSARLRAQDFYLERHQHLYEAMLELTNEGAGVDLRTLQAKLEQQGRIAGVGGIAYLASLDLDLPDLGRIDTYVEIVKERSIRRRLIQASGGIIRDCLDGGLEANAALDRAEQAILGLGEEAIQRGFVPLAQVFHSTLEDLEERPGTTLIGVPSGFIDFDQITHGLNRGNLIIVAGRPGMGKCLSADAELVEADGGVRTIGEVVERRSARLLTLAADRRFEWTSPSAFVDDGIKPVFEVTTRLGRRVKVTATHPFLTLAGWRRLEELQVGEAIGVPRRLEVFGTASLGEDKARLLGYLLGDGGLTGNAARFTNGSPLLREDFAEAVARFGGVRVTEADSGGARTPTLTVVADEIATAAERARFAESLDEALAACGASARRVAAAAGVSPASVTGWRRGRYVPAGAAATALESILPVQVPAGARHNGPNAFTRWLAELGLMGCDAHEKFVPDIVFRAPEPELASFLNRLFATDGWVSTWRSGQVQVGFASCSERLARQVQHLLLRFGVIAGLRRRGVRYRGGTRHAWQLDITERESILTFLTRIGAYGKDVQVRRALAALSRREPNRRVIPFPLQTQNELYWDRITAIRYLGAEQVYDLTIPDTHNFVANDICVHNTSFALNIAQHVAIREKRTVGIFSLEMSQQELALRVLCSEADISFKRLRSGDLSRNQWTKVIQTVRATAETPLYIDDSPNPTLLEMASKARRLKAEKGLELAIVDYLQLMQAGGRYENRNLEIAAISRGLKQLAKELEIPVMALSQLSRQPERRGSDHRPQLADLRESGALEQDADLVAFIYRDEVYNPEDPDNKGIAEVIIAKHRNGQTGTVQLVFIGENTSFRNHYRDSQAAGAPF